MKKIFIWIILILITCVFSSCIGDEQRLTDGVTYYPPRADTQIAGVFDYFTDTTEEIKASDIVTTFSEEITVYITPSGKKYHYSETCPGKNSKLTTLKEAVESGRDSCKRCVK